MAKHPEVYHSKNWFRARHSALTRSNGCCEMCKSKGLITAATTIHHIIELNDRNKKDWDIAYNPKNLKAVCRNCHEELHNRVGNLKDFVTPLP